jgi:hypothetical protein
LENSPYKENQREGSKWNKQKQIPEILKWRDGYQIEWDKRFKAMREDAYRENIHNDLKYHSFSLPLLIAHVL